MSQDQALQGRRHSRLILTPDQRLRVFVSSTLRELAEERTAVREVISQLSLTPVMFEMGARPHPPRALYRSYLDQSHVFIGIYWESYGWVAPEESVSGLEDEYRLSAHLPRLLYVKEPASEREPALTALLKAIQADDVASYRRFETTDELAQLVTDDLMLLLSEQFEVARHVASASNDAELRLTPPGVPLTPILGRDDELRSLEQLIREGSRLITVTGAGGIGKSRLVAEVAHRLQVEQQIPIHFVDLTPVTTPDAVPSQIAESLGLPIEGRRRAIDTLIDHLANRHMVLLLDNFEHVASAGVSLVELTGACPRLQLLVTSRQVLRLRGEREFPLTPLPVPPLEGPNDLIRTNPAVRLFVQQAKAAQPKFELTSDNLASVAEICRRLDGLPLAVELAAARVRLLPPDLLLTRLETRLDLLSSGAADLPERQRTLLNTIDWSYNLLGPEEQALFAQLAIFADGWTLDAAEDVCTVSSGDVLDVLVALLEKSLLVVVSPSQAGEPRMRMLGPVHQYAEQKLVASDERATLQQRHAEYFAKLVEEHHSEIRSQDQESWSLRLSTEAGNLRAAAEWWLAKSDGEALGRFLWATNLHYWLSGNLQELSRLVRAAKPLVDCMSRGTLGRFRIVQGYDARNFGAIDEAAKNFEEAISLLESQGDDFGIGLARLVLSETRNWLGDSRAAGDLEEVFANPVLLGDPWLRAMALWIRAECALTVGDLEQAQLLASQAVDPARELGSWVGQGLERAGFIYVQAGRPDAASAALKEAVACFRHMHYREGLAHCLQSLASLLLMFGDAEAAAQALAAAEATHELIGASMWPMYRPNFDALRNQLQTILGDQFEDVWRRGNSIDVYRSTDNALAALALVEG